MAINYLDILIEYKELTLPGVGRFSVSHHPAEIDKEQGLIFPPYKKINFESRGSDIEYSKEIAAYLQMKFGFSKADAVEVSKFESRTFAEKRNSASIIPIPFVGRIFAGKNGEWLFTPDDIEIFREERKGFPVLPYIPVNQLSVNPVSSVVSEENKEENFITEVDSFSSLPPAKTKRGSFTWWPFSLAAMVMVIAFFLWQQQSSKESAYKVFRMASPDTRINVKPLESDRLYPQYGTEEPENIQIDSSAIEEEERHDISSGAWEGTVENLRGEEPLVSEEVEKKEPVSPLDNSVSKDIAIAEISTNNPELGANDCLLIVGAFASMENVEKMRVRLGAYGSSVVTDTDVKLTRVGVLIPCDSYELPVILEKLRNEINAGTWVMKKK